MVGTGMVGKKEKIPAETVASPVMIWDGELRHEAALAALLLPMSPQI